MIAQVVEIVTERGPQVTGPSGPWQIVAVVGLSLLAYGLWVAFVYSRYKK